MPEFSKNYPFQTLTLVFLTVVLAGCSARPSLNSGGNNFAAWTVELNSGPTPWNHADFDAGQGQIYLCSFF